MLIAYILTKQRRWVIRPIVHPDEVVFTYKGFEYYIDPDCIYSKKFFGFKTFFCIIYVQNNPKPLKFTDIGILVDSGEVPIDEIARLMRKIRKGALGEIAEYCAIASAVMLLVVLYMVWTIGNGMGFL